MISHRITLRAAMLAALFVAGAAQAQLKAPGAPASPAAPSAPAGQGGGNVLQPNMPDPLSAEFRSCIQKVQDAAQQTKAADPVAAQACFGAETKRQEGKIATNGQKVVKSLTPAEKKRFDDAQGAWRRFRDVECAFFADPKGTPPEAANNAQCVLDRTIKRALDLDSLALAFTEKAIPPAAGGAPAPAAPAAPAK